MHSHPDGFAGNSYLPFFEQASLERDRSLPHSEVLR
jgi:hypothetical protein